MIFPVKADIVFLLENLVQSLRPFAEAQDVSLGFRCSLDTIIAKYQPEQIIPSLTQIVCRVITFTPQNYGVTTSLKKCVENSNCVSFIVCNTGADLSRLSEIRNGLRYQIRVTSLAGVGTRFEIQIPIDLAEKKNEKAPPGVHDMIPPWYAEIRKRLLSHFSKADRLAAAIQKNPQDGIFLQKVNAVINSHMQDENFCSEDMSRAVALSRTQLHRKIKELTSLSPMKYLKYCRLKKAKSLLESGKLNVTEAAYHVGFASPSHFSRSFHQEFGFNPSAIRHSEHDLGTEKSATRLRKISSGD